MYTLQLWNVNCEDSRGLTWTDSRGLTWTACRLGSRVPVFPEEEEEVAGEEKHG